MNTIVETKKPGLGKLIESKNLPVSDNRGRLHRMIGAAITVCLLLSVTRIAEATMNICHIYGMVVDANTGEQICDYEIVADYGIASFRHKPLSNGFYVATGGLCTVKLTVYHWNHYTLVTDWIELTPNSFDWYPIALTPYPSPHPTHHTPVPNRPWLEKKTAPRKAEALQAVMEMRPDLVVKVAFEQPGCDLKLFVENIGKSGIMPYFYTLSDPFLKVKTIAGGTQTFLAKSRPPAEKSFTLKEIDPDQKLATPGGRVTVTVARRMNPQLQIQVEAQIDPAGNVNELREDITVLPAI